MAYRALPFNWTTANRRLGDDEMFRERIAHWARLLDLFTCTMSTVIVLARVRAGSLLTETFRNGATATAPYVDTRRDMAIAYMQVSRLNR
jgi:hypothetical protein